MRRIVLVSVAFLLVVGCGPSGSSKGVVKGTITYNGKPVNAVAILLYPSVDKEAVSISVPVTQDGAFNSDDVPVGDYHIVIKPSNAPKNMTPGTNSSPGGPTPTIPFPDKYKEIKSTDLTCSVKTGDQTPLKLELKD
ncbi:MAG TPA: hypothetical protein DDY78_09115 [Planctomycetales bacterium]|jgi:hypothetical protein|nr:hypothetical protein [Planctomycetales bacterium]